MYKMYPTMSYETRQLPLDEWPSMISEISDPPKQLFVRGELPPHEWKWLTVVGSRAISGYGEDVCKKLIAGLATYPIVIVSGLALGTDACAHRAALDAGLPTVAVPGSGISDHALYPRTNVGLAKKILQEGGALLSEFDPDFRATPWSFPQRNRIMAGISHAVLVIEAGEKSGTLITSRLATEYNRDVLAVPGPIFAPHSSGPHMLIRLGATPITSSQNIIEALGFEIQKEAYDSQTGSLTETERSIVEMLRGGATRDEVLVKMNISTSELSTHIVSLELRNFL